jgi:LPXTG-site transpeptidase (sortase) family protein
MINKSFHLKSWIGYCFLVIGFSLIAIHVSWYIRSQFQPTIFNNEKVQVKKHVLLQTNTFYKEGQLIGSIYLPNVHKSMNIYEGTNQKTLEKGIGHFLKSSLPGEKNNSILSGHRDTFFRSLKDIKPKDTIYIETATGIFYYKVRKIDIVSSNNHNVLSVKSRPILTLTTCYPFYYLGDAPKRYIVTADLIKSYNH